MGDYKKVTKIHSGEGGEEGYSLNCGVMHSTCSSAYFFYNFYISRDFNKFNVSTNKNTFKRLSVFLRKLYHKTKRIMRAHFVDKNF